MPLELRDLPHPHADATVTVFGDWIAAARHVCDHVLTSPESEGWELLLAPLRSVNFQDRSSRFKLAHAGWRRSEGEALQEAYDAYAREVTSAIGRATEHGWYWCESLEDREWGVRHFFGPNGVLVVLGLRSVITAMLPGMGDPRTVHAHMGTVDSPETRRHNPLPREERRAGFGMRRAPELDEPQLAGSLNSWHARYLLFRKCAGVVREAALGSFWSVGDESEQRLHVAIARYEDWLRMQGVDPATVER